MLTTHGVFQMWRLEAGGEFHETSLCPWPPVSRAKAGTCVMEMGWEGFPGILEQLLATAFHAHTP